MKIQPEDGEINVAGKIERELYDRINFNVIVEDTNISSSQSRQFATGNQSYLFMKIQVIVSTIHALLK